jgi:hypothetical protein
MANLLGRPTEEISTWNKKANRTAELVQLHLYDETGGDPPAPIFFIPARLSLPVYRNCLNRAPQKYLNARPFLPLHLLLAQS